MADERVDEKSFECKLACVEREDGNLELTLRLKNKARRALYYISDIRTIRYDAAAKRLVVGLNDEGRELVPGAAAKLPDFKYVDPESEAELQLVLPRHIVKLAENPSTLDPLRLEKQTVDEAAEVAVEIAWADTPYYKDTRKPSVQAKDKRLPSVRWQQHKLSATTRLPGKRE